MLFVCNTNMIGIVTNAGGGLETDFEFIGLSCCRVLHRYHPVPEDYDLFEASHLGAPLLTQSPLYPNHQSS